MMENLRLGTSGWSYDEWVGPFYASRETPKLTYYSQVFQTAEIDSTFYAYPNERMVYGWLRHSGSDFAFSAKLPQVITHEKMLGQKGPVEEDFEKFLDVMQPLSLNGKLLAILIQLPPSFKQDLDILESFLKILPKNPRFSIEFRHKSWWNEETWRLLERYKIANTIVDEPLLPSDPIVTTDFAYVRWHGKGNRIWYNYEYSNNELKPWTNKVREITKKSGTTVGYFNNHFHGYAVENCLQVLDMLGVATPKQIEAEKRAEQHIHPEKAITTAGGTLTSYLPKQDEKGGPSTEDLLLLFMDKERLNRAKGIRDDELSFIENKPGLLRIDVRTYTIRIDQKERTISHDCDDWRRQAQERKFCKHLGKLFLSLREDYAKRILATIRSEEGLWQFRVLE
ncbi:DUF72 domain-containing protein [Candidatus Bathyarchaeota archaeon]|nr:DUF72 domain-containing protein [Candidatus Bathyarchaeota archaeon]